MMEFTFWDILRNLLLATRWTLLLPSLAEAWSASRFCGCALVRVRPWAVLPASISKSFRARRS